MPTDEQLAADIEAVKRGIVTDVEKAKTKIGQWIATTFPPMLGIPVTIALLQFAIETQLTLTGDEDHSRKLINHIFNDVVRFFDDDPAPCHNHAMPRMTTNRPRQRHLKPIRRTQKFAA